MSEQKDAMRNRDAKHIDFGFLRGIISSCPTLLPSDIDMVFERNGKILIGEWKYCNMATNTLDKIGDGQAILLKALNDKEDFTVLRVHHNNLPNGQINIVEFAELHGGTYIPVGKGVDQFKKYVSDWWDKANEKT